MIRYATFRYDLTSNLGDEIQTLAVEQHLPRVDQRVDRDSLARFEPDDPTLVVMQGWFTKRPHDCFPPSPRVIPVFVGFHLTDQYPAADAFLAGAGLARLKESAPIGCRDDFTRERLKAAGVDAFTSGCLTSTFPARGHQPENGRVFIVDARHLPLPETVTREAVHLTHEMAGELGDEVKSRVARRLLELCRDQARLVITTRLHCALPCIAMGIPVVFLGDPDDPRLSVLRSLRVPVHRALPRSYATAPWWKFHRLQKAWARRAYQMIDWDPAPVDVDPVRRELTRVLREALARAEAAVTDADGGSGVG